MELRFTYPVEYDAGWQFGRYGTQPSVKIGGAYIEGEPGSDEKAARYSAFCDGMCAGTRARWDAGGATEREQKLLDHVHETWRRLGIEPLPRSEAELAYAAEHERDEMADDAELSRIESSVCDR